MPSDVATCFRSAELPDDRAPEHAHMLKVLSHELRTPLTPLLGYLDLLRDDVEENATALRDRIEAVTRQVARVLDLASDMSAAAEPAVLRLRRTTLGAVVRTALDLATDRRSRGDVSVALDVDDLATARVDPDLLSQALRHVLHNAIKFSTQFGTVRVRARRVERHALITVRNDGPEVPVEDRDRVFEPWHRGADAVRYGRSGLGLGLPTARRIVHAHGGMIGLRSSSGSTEVRLLLPWG